MLPKLYWRVYLQQGNYPAARDAAHDVIENSDVLYPLNMQIRTMMSIKSRTILSIQITNKHKTAHNLYASENNGGRIRISKSDPIYLAKFTDQLTKDVIYHQS
jgi:hypothetical protein